MEDMILYILCFLKRAKRLQNRKYPVKLKQQKTIVNFCKTFQRDTNIGDSWKKSGSRTSISSNMAEK